ncbi:MAG: hypothetical protein SPL00_05005 [Bacilli bacterium]|nr:hypothetical protein [Bacilli bacterium]
MKKFSLKNLFFSLTCLFFLQSCSIWNLVPEGSNSSTRISSESIINTSSEDIPTRSVLPFSMYELGKNNWQYYCPSTGNVRALVIPVEFTDFPFASNYADVLDRAFNGNGVNSTGYWESASSFYKKSSYGKLNISFTIAPKYQTGMNTLTAISRYGTNSGQVQDNAGYFLKEAIANYKKSASTKQFDSNSDGFIDNVILVYSANNAKNTTRYSDTFFWAYTYWAPYTRTGRNDTSWVYPNVVSPTPNTYIWLSIDFFSHPNSRTYIDAHTLIHEMGHSFGLDDYYPTDESNFYPAGGLDMMDLNILDHDAYSKMILGWYEPVVVDKECVVSISALASKGEAILIPGSKWNGTAYDEYMLVEFYKPVELNYLDSHTRYPNRTLGYSVNGVKVYHIDSRLIEIDTQERIKFVDITNVNQFKDDCFYQIGPSNNAKIEEIKDYSLLHLMEANGVFTFKYGQIGTNDTLFKVGNSFSLNTFSSFFPKRTTFNSGATFNYRITVNSIGSDSAQIRISSI